jgi:ribonuclease VapC
VIVDTSALAAVVFREPGFETPIKKLTSASSVGIGTPTLAELGLVLSARLRLDPRALVSRLLDEFAITTVPFGDDHWREAVGAYQRYGRGRHEAKLNFGDCLTYAVARLADEPLLYVGNDFAATDLTPA